MSEFCNYGTIHPESVVAHNGNVFWLDSNKAAFCQYSQNGIDEISGGAEGKFRRPTKVISSKLNALSAATIESYGSRPFVFGGVDPYHGEIYWSIPTLGGNPKGILEDYSADTAEGAPAAQPYLEVYNEIGLYSPLYSWAVEYPYDISNLAAKTLVYSRRHSRWLGSFTIKNSEGWVSIGTSVYSFKNGVMYEHGNSTAYNTFYGTSYRSKLAFVCNEGNTVKEFGGITIEASRCPEWIHFRTEHPFVQSSDLTEDDFTMQEGLYRSSILRDRFSPNTPGDYNNKQMLGDMIRGQALFVLVQFNNTTSQTWFRLASLVYNQSSGHY